MIYQTYKIINHMKFKEIFTALFLIIVIIVAIKPSQNNSKKSYGQSDLDISMNAASRNYDTFDNFIFQFENTISGWFGKSVDNYNRPYLSESSVERDWFLMLGKYLPYLCILLIIVMFLIRLPLKIK